MEDTKITVALNGADITGMVTKVEWSGNIEEAARSCSISYVNAPYDPVVKSLPVPVLGDYISVSDHGAEIFFGRINGAEKSSNYGSISATCVEDSNLLAKNKCKYNFFGHESPESITAKILADYGFPVGSLEGTGVEITSLVINGDTILDAIGKAYGEATKKTGDKYRVFMRGRAVCVEKQGRTAATYLLSEAKNILETHYTEKSDNLVNRVVLYDKNGDRTGEITDGASMGRYGTYTEIASDEVNVDAGSQGASMLNGPEQTLSVKALGNAACVAGCAVTIEDTATNIHGTYWIKSDSHTWENNVHTMDLELDFKTAVRG